MKTFFALCVMLAEFTGFWTEPNTEFCRSEWGQHADGKYHVGRILKANPAGPHRAYPTFQPWKTEGAYGPCMLSLDFKYWTPQRTPSQWFSVLTLARDTGNGDWDPVTINIDEKGNLALMHVPVHGQEVYTALAPAVVSTDIWQHLDVIVGVGSVTVLLNGRAVLFALSKGLDGLPQAHAGLYAEGSLSEGWMANSNLRVSELAPVRKVN